MADDALPESEDKRFHLGWFCNFVADEWNGPYGSDGEPWTGDFYIEIDRVLRDLLAARLRRPVAGLRMDELSGVLRARGLPDDIVGRVLGELEECDMARVAPGSGGVGQERMSAALERAADLIEALEKAPLREETT